MDAGLFWIWVCGGGGEINMTAAAWRDDTKKRKLTMSVACEHDNSRMERSS
jgi:hypothetical protein